MLLASCCLTFDQQFPKIRRILKILNDLLTEFVRFQLTDRKE